MGAALVLEMAAAVPDNTKLSTKPKLCFLEGDILSGRAEKKVNKTCECFGKQYKIQKERVRTLLLLSSVMSFKVVS